VRLDGKETRAVIQQTTRKTTTIMQLMANNVSEVTSPSSRNPSNPSHSRSNRMPVATGPSKVVLVSRFIHKPCYPMWRSAPGNRKLVLPRQSFRRVEVHWLPALDPWQACVIHPLSAPLSDMYFFYSGLREECPLVRCLCGYVSVT
jgi:hypothetical protein